MHSNHNIILTNNDSLIEDEETTWSLPGAVIGFTSWLLMLTMPMSVHGFNTPFSLIYIWPFFLALIPVVVVVGIMLHSLMDGKLRYNTVFTPVIVGTMFGASFMWLLDQFILPCLFCSQFRL